MPRQYREPDTCITPEDKNTALAQLLLGRWNPIEIVRIERRDEAQFNGWIATERNDDLAEDMAAADEPARGPVGPRPDRPPR